MSICICFLKMQSMGLLWPPFIGLIKCRWWYFLKRPVLIFHGFCQHFWLTFLLLTQNSLLVSLPVISAFIVLAKTWVLSSFSLLLKSPHPKHLALASLAVYSFHGMRLVSQGFKTHGSLSFFFNFRWIRYQSLILKVNISLWRELLTVIIV